MMEDNWVWRLISGLILVVLGVLLLTYTGITILILIQLFGLFMLFLGMFEILFGIHTPKGSPHKWLFVLRGFLSLVIGLLAILLPDVTLLVTIYLIAAWAILWGMFELAAAFTGAEDHKLHVYGHKGRWFAVAAGVFAILLGFAIVTYPDATLDVIVLSFGLVIIVVGLFTAISGFHSRNKKKDLVQDEQKVRKIRIDRTQ